VAVFAVHAAVEEIDGEAGKFVDAEALEDGFGGSGVVFRLSFDAGADDVGLASLTDLLAEEIPDFAKFCGGADFGGDDFLSTGWEIFDDGHVEIAELCEAEAAGDWCGGHDKDMGTESVAGVARTRESGALANAEAVLFVDDGDPEACEPDGVLDECLSADDELHGAIGDATEEFATSGGGESAEEQTAGDPAGAEELIECFPVLCGEDFGGGHEDCLSTGGDGSEQCVDGDGGFSGADIGLEEPVHGLRSVKISDDLTNGFVLSGGEAEVEQAADAGIDLGGDGDGSGLELAGGVSAKCEPQLEFEEIVEEHAVSGLFPLGAILGDMEGADGGGKFREFVLLAEVDWERIGEAIGAVFDGGASEPAHGIHADAIGEWISREHTGAVFGVFVGGQHVDFGGVEFPASSAAAGSAVEEQAVTELIAVDHPGLVEPEAADEVAVAVEKYTHEATATLGGAGIAFDNDALNGLEGVGQELWNGFEVGEVVDIGGDVEEQIAGGFDLQVAKQGSALGADTADELYWCEQPIGGDVAGGDGSDGGSDRDVGRVFCGV
jgi:hypothetical protein